MDTSHRGTMLKPVGAGQAFDGVASVFRGQSAPAAARSGVRRNDQQSKDRAAILRLLEGSGQSVAAVCREQGLPPLEVNLEWQVPMDAGSVIARCLELL